MNATFLVTLSTSDTDFLIQAEEISDILSKAGLDILTVHPWARKETQTPLPSIKLPPPKPL